MTRFLGVATFATLVLATAPAFAQPSRGNQTKAGAAGVGIGSVFNFASSTNELDNGDLVKNRTLFLRLGPKFEYFFTDGVPVQLSVDWLRRSVSRGEDETAAQNDALFLVGTGFHLPTTPKFNIILGASLGGYFGSSSREQLITDADGNVTTVNEATSTKGLGLSAKLGSSYQFGDHAQFRAGLVYTGLFGNETITSTGTTLATTTHNMGLDIAVYWFF